MPLAYHGHAAAEATLREAMATAIAVPPLAPVGSAIASGPLVPPGGGQLVLVQLGIELGPRASLTLYQRLNLMPGEPLACTVSVPLPPGATYRWTVESHGPVDAAAATRVIPDALGLSLFVPGAPRLTDDGQLTQSSRRDLVLAP